MKAKKALADMATGQTLKVISTDQGSIRDFQAFARQTGNELLEQERKRVADFADTLTKMREQLARLA